MSDELRAGVSPLALALSAVGGPQLDSLGVVSVKKARQLLADKGHTQIYDDIKQGRLDARKDGDKTVITVASILARIDGMPRVPLIEPHELVAGKAKKRARIETAAARAKKHSPARRSSRPRAAASFNAR
jgi:hypothetical protein